MRNKIVSPNPLASFLHKVFLSQKLNNWVGFIVVTIIATTYGYLLSKDLVLGLGVFGLVVGVSVLIACIANAELGLYLTVLYAFFASGLSRFIFKDKLPVGVMIDILIFTTFLGLFISNHNLKKEQCSIF